MDQPCRCGASVATDAENLGKLYRSRGYMTAQIKPDAQLDDEKSTVHYDVNIVEGDLYKMGELEIIGLDTPQRIACRRHGHCAKGNPTTPTTPKKFLDDAPRLLPRGVQLSRQRK